MNNAIQNGPEPYDTHKADEIWAILTSEGHCNPESLPHLQKNKHIADAITGNSPYLAKSIEREPRYATEILTGNTTEMLEAILAPLRNSRPSGETMAELMAILRSAKSRLAMLTAICDVAKWWDLDQVTSALTRFADLSLTLAVAHLLHNRFIQGELKWAGMQDAPVNPKMAIDCGYVVLALGKQGGFELNYSSDIDLIILYDPDKVTYCGRRSLADCMVRMTQDLVQIMDKRTLDGYVFRTDLRLRPDPGATAIAITMDAAENYYHSVALNWERSAMIKARPVAGDITAGENYLQSLSGWIWRRHLDFEALRDIQSIKNQIGRHYDQQTLGFEGYDVKLGPGGIREIEFFAQINQLILGGKNYALRGRRTTDTLDTLVKIERLDAKVCDHLKEAYVFLRTLEHRLQMIQDEQTHTIPESPDHIARLTAFMGFTSPDTLKAALIYHTGRAKDYYDTLLPGAPDDSILSLASLTSLIETCDFADKKAAITIIEGWSRGRYKALKTTRARQLLSQCLEGLLTAFHDSGEPDAALRRFDAFIVKLPAGVQLFSLLQSNPALFGLVGRIMGVAPGLADQLAKRATLWEAVLEPHFYDPLPDIAALNEDLNEALKPAIDYQDILDFSRRWVAEKRFQVGVQTLESIAETFEAGQAITRIADVVVKRMLVEVEANFQLSHGKLKGGELAILAMGKYGGFELTYTSDLDVVFLYHVDDMQSKSDGEKALSPSHYYSRLGQNIITAITALTSEGRLFEVDTRLRPSGNQGPLVVTLETFANYYRDAAWTWEHMALTRARVVVASPNMASKLHDVIRTTLGGKRDRSDLSKAVLKMRQLLAKEFNPKTPWSIKHVRGGLIDMEFIVQFLLLREGAENARLFTANLDLAIKRLQTAAVLSESAASCLTDAHHLQQTIQSLLRLCLGDNEIKKASFQPGLADALLKATGQKNFSALTQALEKSQAEVYQLFNKIIVS